MRIFFFGVFSLAALGGSLYAGFRAFNIYLETVREGMQKVDVSGMVLFSVILLMVSLITLRGVVGSRKH